ncbi:MAG: ATP-binding cassette domain-containing protein [Bacilli bacterium]|nr:ATP-binding cassette domain-containing protein [Bacilli bacterium]
MKIDVKNINKSFKGNLVLNNVNMHFETGNIYGLSGRNGSGKSVLLKVLTGLYKADSGTISINDKVIDYKKEFIENLGSLIEGPKFFSNLTGFENLKFLANIKGKIKDEDILNTLETVNLISEKDKKYSKYSLGMKQKLGIAAAIMENPDILILDEPFNGIEDISVLKIKNYLKEIKENKIIILSTHIKEDLEELSDHIYYFDAGMVSEIKNV